MAMERKILNRESVGIEINANNEKQVETLRKVTES